MINITKIRIYPFDTSELGGMTKAYAEIVINDCLLIKGFRIIETEKKGLFIGYPSQRGKKDKYYDLIVPLHSEVKKMIRDLILREYKREILNEGGCV